MLIWLDKLVKDVGYDVTTDQLREYIRETLKTSVSDSSDQPMLTCIHLVVISVSYFRLFQAMATLFCEKPILATLVSENLL